MKKLLLTASLMLGFCGLARAERYEVPSAQTDQQASIFYGGVKYASSTFSTAVSTVTTSTTTYSSDYGVNVYGVLFSTGACGDYVDVIDNISVSSASRDMALGPPARFRIYNVAGSTTGASTGGSALGGVCSGFSGVFGLNQSIPVRLRARAWFASSSINYNSIMLYYWKPE